MRIPRNTTLATVRALALCFTVPGLLGLTRAPIVITGPAILDHAIGKLALTSMAMQREGKFDEFLKFADLAYNERYAGLTADRKKRLAATMKDAALPAETFRENIKKLGVLTIDGVHATLTTKETVNVGAGMKATSGLELRFTFEAGLWKAAP